MALDHALVFREHGVFGFHRSILVAPKRLLGGKRRRRGNRGDQFVGLTGWICAAVDCGNGSQWRGGHLPRSRHRGCFIFSVGGVGLAAAQQSTQTQTIMSKSNLLDRREFLAACIAATAGGSVYGKESAAGLETFSQWLKASPRQRRFALQLCLDRIRELESSIHAWVQVSPQRPTGQGRLSEIPFGVKDIVETRGLATEYGSPIYKGRIGTADAPIIRELRKL